MEVVMGASFTLAEIADLVKGDLAGDPEKRITGVNTLTDAGGEEIVYLQDRRYLAEFKSTRAGAALVPRGLDFQGVDTIAVDRPRLAFTRIAQLFHPLLPEVEKGVHETALLAESVHLGQGVSIGAYAIVGNGVRLGRGGVVGPLCVIGPGVSIGEGSYLFASVVVREGVRIGRQCVIHPGVVLGSDGFGYEADERGEYMKIPHVGGIVIEDNVEIGANVTIARAAMGETRIARGTKLDNLVHIAHNVQIGENGLLCAQVGVAGSTRIGRRVVIGGQAGLIDHLKVGDFVRIGAQAGVTKSVEDGETVSGYPARPHRIAMKKEAILSRIVKMYDTIKHLTKRVETIERELTDDGRRSEHLSRDRE
jgi:UDP-3-O-[3-hydroxymyristoyl] glucosamine N-acyltransferase